MFESQVSLQDRLIVGKRKRHRSIRRCVVLLVVLLMILFFLNTQHAWAQPGQSGGASTWQADVVLVKPRTEMAKNRRFPLDE